MSQENVEIARRWLATMSRGPEEALAALAEVAEAEAEYYPVRKFPEARPCHGLEQFAQFISDFSESYARIEWVIQKAYEVGDDRVMLWARMRAEGRASGMDVEGDVFHCFWFRHGRFFRQEDHLTVGGALWALGLEGDTLEAAGLSE